MTDREARAHAHHVAYCVIGQSLAQDTREELPEADIANIDKHQDRLAQYHWNKWKDLEEPPRKRKSHKPTR